MLRVRFHGRGGHGVKTAGRILGTAAFRAGFQAQDCPLYGAERRGAAVTAYTRFDEGAILERGVISQPDLIIVGDETLLESGSTAVLAGQESASAVFVNCPDNHQLATKYAITAPLVALDLTALALAVLGKASALSTGLGAAAARLSGCIAKEHLLDAVRGELSHAELESELIQKNLRLASEVFEKLPQAALATRAEATVRDRIHRVQYDDPRRGTPSILAAGNAAARMTGSWRVERPEVDRSQCTRCGICFIRCPDGAIALDEEGYPVIDYDHCKGCMICWEQCPVGGAMERRKEVRAW